MPIQIQPVQPLVFQIEVVEQTYIFRGEDWRVSLQNVGAANNNDSNNSNNNNNKKEKERQRQKEEKMQKTCINK